MSKVLRTAAMVVGVAAIAVATAGAGLALASGVALSTGITAATAVVGVSLSTLATVSAGLTLAANLTAKKPGGLSGMQTSWQSDPNAGLPYVMGRTRVSGNIVFRYAYGSDNAYQSIVTVLSAGGPIQAMDGLYLDDAAQTVTGGSLPGKLNGLIWHRHQLGATPEASALTSPAGAIPGWTSSSKLSGYAATMLTLKFDAKGKTQLTREPKAAWLVRGVKVYDPRLDSTYPGGSGACRALVESTYVYSENPWLHALTWCLGRWQNGKRVIGIGAPIAGVDVAAYVEAANVADANGWKIGGQVTSRPDTKWNALKAMCQAGGGFPIALGAKISCIVNTPRVSLTTVTTNDLAGGAKLTATQPRRDRINGVVPRYRSEAHSWEIVPAKLVDVPAHVTFDGGPRTREIEYSLVQQAGQAAQLARYDIEDSREFGPIDLPLKLRFYGYKPGDVVTVNIPEIGLNGQTVLLLDRSLSPASGIVSFSARSETAGKHPFALGQTTTPPPTAGVSGPALVPTPTTAEWAITATSIVNGAEEIPALVIGGESASIGTDAIVFEYRPYTGTQGPDDDWIGAGVTPTGIRKLEVTSVTGDTQYQVSITYRLRGEYGARLILGPVTTSPPLAGTPGADGAGAYTLVAEGSATVTPTSVTKTASGWNGGAHTSIAYKDAAQMLARVPAGHHDFMVGLTTAPGAAGHYNTGDYNIYAIAGELHYYRRGVYQAPLGQCQAGDLIGSRSNDYRVEYFRIRDGREVVLASHAPDHPNQRLYGMVSSAPDGYTVDGIAFAAVAPVAKSLFVEQDKRVITYDRLDAISPAVQTTTFRATADKINGDILWQLEDAAGNLLNPVSYINSIYGSVTNLMPMSQDLSAAAYWSVAFGTAVSPNTHVAPDGTLTADTITSATATDDAYIYNPITVANDGVWRTGSIFLKKTVGATTFPQVGIQYQGGATAMCRLAINTDTGEAVETGWTGGAPHSVEDYGDYWRVVMPLPNNSLGNTTFLLILFPASGFTASFPTLDVTATGSIVVWGGQLLEGGLARTYIKTGATGITAMAGPEVSMTAANFNAAKGSTGGVVLRAVACDGAVFTASGSLAKVKDGADGLSIAELTVYRRGTSAPAMPSGGSYNFTTGVLTPPSSWSASIPAGNDPLYAATGTVAVQGIGGTATPTWAGVGLLAQEGSAVDMIFRRSASQPATPSASATVPAGWYSDTGGVPAGADPIWVSFGSRPNAGANWTWQVAKRFEGPAGTPGTSPLSMAFSPGIIPVACSSTGVPKSGALPKTSQTIVRHGNTPVEASSTYSITPTDCAATISAAGLITVTDVTAINATLSVTATYDGVSQTRVLEVTQTRDGVSPTGTFTGGRTETITVLVPAYGSCNLQGRIQYTGTTTSGTAVVQILSAPSGSTTWTVRATASAAYGPSEGWAASPSTTFVNATGTDVLMKFRIDGSGWSGIPIESGCWIKGTVSTT
ncbi:hypothetical protein SAMN06295912_108111 [Sphingomonas laterariae]|uniref:Phage tail protein n=1 Tax=Edaphosphingomonas laterariae TaxID=861865 RepID=A0A239F9Q8_9SPHN|nr:hypothetical protein [Sphingomonas laterariae]SNS53043.1 hypothetical protein SAMN06295912_108111 [Sphingomonas laterariae]